MSKKRGFTLVEVLVVIAIATLVFALVGGTFVFLATSSGNLIHKSESIIQAQTIEKHLRSFVSEDNRVNNDIFNQSMISFDSDKDTLTIKGSEYENVQDYSISLFYLDDNGVRVNNKNPAGDTFVECAIQLINNNKTTNYTFILGIYTEH